MTVFCRTWLHKPSEQQAGPPKQIWLGMLSCLLAQVASANIASASETACKSSLNKFQGTMAWRAQMCHTRASDCIWT